MMSSAPARAIGIVQTKAMTVIKFRNFCILNNSLCSSAISAIMIAWGSPPLFLIVTTAAAGFPARQFANVKLPRVLNEFRRHHLLIFFAHLAIVGYAHSKPLAPTTNWAWQARSRKMPASTHSSTLGPQKVMP